MGASLDELPRLSGERIVCFSSMDWDDNPTSKYHLMRLLARRNRVWCIETLGTRAPRVQDFPRLIRRLKRWVHGAQQHTVPNAQGGWLRTYAPLVIPYHEIRGTRWINRRLLTWSLRRLLRKEANGRPPLVWTYTPRMMDIIDLFPSSMVIYHCVDEWSTYPGGETPAFQQLEAALLRRADLVFVPNEQLLMKKRQFHPRVQLIPHGVEVEHFMKAASDDPQGDPPELARLPHPRIVLVGTLASWVDMGLLADVARAFPGGSVVLIGYRHMAADQQRFRKLCQQSNVHWLGPRPYADLPRYYRAVDVCLAPFMSNEHLQYASPTKLVEYLATGKPVVSTDIPAARVWSGWVRIGRTSPDIIEQIRIALREETAGQGDERRQVVRFHSWEVRLCQMEQEIVGAMQVSSRRSDRAPQPATLSATEFLEAHAR